ncbi:MAG: ArnT family glycosyltransferase [Acidobacteriaceae bacterium]
MSDSTQHEALSSPTPVRTWQRPSFALSWEVVLLIGFTAFFFFYGLVPYFGGAQLGLLGADEPRYAQVAREMLARHDFITPILYGKPWLEKPALYYWRAMFSFQEFGVHDWSARIPSASAAFMLIVLIYLHMRRFRPGGQLDAALITASCAGILSFARGASTDMQLAAPFCIGMLGWYAWYETDRKFWLFDLYFFIGAATLAKGPVAPFMALFIILLFAGLRREWSLLRRTIWLPGIILYLAMVLPWYIAVQRRNPTFFREFFLQHNLERFATNRYEHHQHMWYYLVVLLLALMPWVVLSMTALVDSIKISIAEWKVRHNPSRYLGLPRAGDAFPEFLVLWALFPVLFFTFSESKLPGYILPAIPPITILTGDYLNRSREKGLRSWLLIAHALTAGVLTFVLLLSPQYMVYEKIVPQTRILVAAGAVSVAMVVTILVIVVRFGAQRVRIATLIPIVLLVFFLMKFNGHLLDLNYSARPLAKEIQQDAPGIQTLAVYKVRRDLDYGLAFYRNHPVVYYESEGVPAQEHILVVNIKDIPELHTFLEGRAYEPLFLYQWRGLAVYKVYAKQ